MKAFMLFLFYSCALIVLSGVNGIVSHFVADSLSLIIATFLMVLDLIVSIAIGIFAGQYVPEVCVNRTTIERIAGNDAHTYDKGREKNIQQVFGEYFWLWFLPIPPNMGDLLWNDMELDFAPRVSQQVPGPQDGLAEPLDDGHDSL